MSQYILVNKDGFWSNDQGFVFNLGSAARFTEDEAQNFTLIADDEPEWVRLDDLIFVFGSNLVGIHDGGAARQAVVEFGAELFVPIGPQGNAYGIATLDYEMEQMPTQLIKQQIQAFTAYARGLPDKLFYVTPVGTGIAGFSLETIDPMFDAARELENVILAWR